MRIDLSDLERLDGFAEALLRLFWFLLSVALIATVLGSAGTGLFLLILGSLAFVAHAGLEDFVYARRERSESGKARRQKPATKGTGAAEAEEPGITVYRSKPSRRSSKPAV